MTDVCVRVDTHSRACAVSLLLLCDALYCFVQLMCVVDFTPVVETVGVFVDVCVIELV